MNKKLLILIIAVGLLGLTYFGYTLNNSSPKQNYEQMPVVIDQEATKEETQPTENVRYQDYSPQVFTANTDKKRVYFFHAKWCPTCKVADQEFTSRANEIPQDVIVFKTDYDTEKDLKTKYGITYQHTFVYVDSAGNELAKWNGGGIAELISNTNKN